MSRLVWDAQGEKTYEYGVSMGVIYPINSSGAYTPGEAWNGLTKVSQNPDGGEANDMWADNIKYGTLRSAEDFKGQISAYNYPPTFEKCNGTAEVANGAYIGQQPRATFGFCYRTEVGSDTNQEAGYKLHLVWGATVSPSDMDYETVNDNPSGIEMSWDFETNPLPVTGHKHSAHMIIDSRAANSTNLAALENELYGADATQSSSAIVANLPLPDAVIGILNRT